MTKRCVFAFRTGGNGITYLDLIIIDDDAVNESFDQFSTLFKGQLLQSELNTLTEVFNASGYFSQVDIAERSLWHCGDTKPLPPYLLCATISIYPNTYQPD